MAQNMKTKSELIEEANKLWNSLNKAKQIARNSLTNEFNRFSDEEDLIKVIDNFRTAANEVISLLNTTLVQNQYLEQDKQRAYGINKTPREDQGR